MSTTGMESGMGSVVQCLFGVGEEVKGSKIKVSSALPSVRGSLKRSKRDLEWGGLQQNLGLAGESPAGTRSRARSTTTSAGGSARATHPQVTFKRLGERAEAAFLAKASGLGFGVAKPWGDSERYDFIVDASQILGEERSGFRQGPSTLLRTQPGMRSASAHCGVENKQIPHSERSGFRLRSPASLTPAKRLGQILRKERSGFRQEAPASKMRSLTPPKRLKLWRVQVKSAYGVGADGGYSFRLFGHSVGAYRADEIDVLVCYLVPEDAWYVFPPEVFRGRRSVKLFGGSKKRRSKFEVYREAWWVLGAGRQ